MVLIKDIINSFGNIRSKLTLVNQAIPSLFGMHIFEYIHNTREAFVNPEHMQPSFLPVISGSRVCLYMYTLFKAELVVTMNRIITNKPPWEYMLKV